MPRKPPVRQIATYLLTLSILTLTTAALASDEPTTMDDWARETLHLPPGFAPDFPSGVEELRFPPGWRDPDSENFWSYAIEMKLNTPVPDQDGLADILKRYYTGLMSAFGVGQKPDSPPNEVTVEIEELAPNTYRAILHLIDGFATHKPKDIIAQVETLPETDTTSTIKIRLSPQPLDHIIWTDLDAALVHISAERLNQHTSPLKPLAHLPQGEWRTVPANKNEQRDVWTWAPGKSALTSITTNRKGTSESIFGSFRVIYHHPQRDELVVLALSAPELIQSGTVTPINDHDLRFDMTLSYDKERIEWITEPIRVISSVWSFDTPTSYANHWIKDQGQHVDPSVTNWLYTNVHNLTPVPPSAHEPPSPIIHLNAFLPLLEHDWETDTTHTTVAWIPYNEAIRIRTIDTRTSDPIEETIIYPHPITKAIHILTIHESGAIDEGNAKLDTDGTIRFEFTRADQDSSRTMKRVLALTPDAKLRDTVFNTDNPDNPSRQETIHRPALKD